MAIARRCQEREHPQGSHGGSGVEGVLEDQRRQTGLRSAVTRRLKKFVGIRLVTGGFRW